MCGSAPNVSHATVTESGRDVLSQASYSCDPGYVLTSDVSTMTCGLDGSWSPEDIICEPSPCDMPSLPTGAILDVLADTFSSGEKVSFSCPDDYVMVPSSSAALQNSSRTMTCVNGNWTILKDQDLDVLCIHCNLPEDKPNATWEIQTESPIKVKYSCEFGFSIAAGHTGILECHEDSGVWEDGPGVSCELLDCGEPIPVGNGTFTATGTKYKDKATYSCSIGYKIVAGDTERYLETHRSYNMPIHFQGAFSTLFI